MILDEPTTGVDPLSRRDFWNILGRLLRERAITALVSTAYLDEASRFDRLALMYDGEISAKASCGAAMRRSPRRPRPRQAARAEGVFISLLHERGVMAAGGATSRGLAANRAGITRWCCHRSARADANSGVPGAVDRLTFDVPPRRGIRPARRQRCRQDHSHQDAHWHPAAVVWLQGHVAGADMRRGTAGRETADRLCIAGVLALLDLTVAKI